MPNLSEAPGQPEEAKSAAPVELSAKRKGKLVVQVRFGLGNRLNAFLSTVLVGEILGVQTEIGWPFRHEECAARFSDLFSLKGLEALYIRDDLEINPDLPKADSYPLGQLKNELMAGRDVFLCAAELFGEALLDGWQFQERIRARLRSLHLAPDVQKLIPRESASAIGVHIRLSDHIPCHIYSPSWCYFETVRAIAATVPSEKIFLCADTPALAEALSKRFSQVVLAPSLRLGLSSERSTVAGLQAALADLWILSGCSMILASPLSSFARVARLLGGAQRFDVMAFGSANNFRGSYIAWSIQSSFEFDLTKRKRRINAIAVAKAPLSTRGYFLLGQFFTSRVYQNLAFPTLKTHLRRKVIECLRSRNIPPPR